MSPTPYIGIMYRYHDYTMPLNADALKWIIVYSIANVQTRSLIISHFTKNTPGGMFLFQIYSVDLFSDLNEISLKGKPWLGLATAE